MVATTEGHEAHLEGPPSKLVHLDNHLQNQDVSAEALHPFLYGHDYMCSEQLCQWTW